VGGLGRIPTIAFGPFKIDTPMAFLSLSIVILIAVLATSTAIVLSPTGRAMRAIASNELAARSIGIGAYGIKTIVFTLAAFFAGIAGSLYAHLSRFIAPDDFGFMLSIVFLTMTIVGGLGNILGGLVGAVLVTLVAEHFRAFPQWQPILHGSAMVLVVLFMPYGICGGIQRLVERFRKKSKPGVTARPQPLPAASLKG
jgi:branched-chain amino acid transport system permease protein